jgi:hypothetical protein
LIIRVSLQQVVKQHRHALTGFAALIACAGPLSALQAGAAATQEVPVASVAQVDPRAKAAWLSECRRRMGADKVVLEERKPKKRKGTIPVVVVPQPTYDYCEAYFDDYYRNYVPAVAASQSAQQSKPETTEVVTEEYVPVRSRSMPRRMTPRLRKRAKS